MSTGSAIINSSFKMTCDNYFGNLKAKTRYRGNIKNNMTYLKNINKSYQANWPRKTNLPSQHWPHRRNIPRQIGFDKASPFKNKTLS